VHAIDTWVAGSRDHTSTAPPEVAVTIVVASGDRVMEVLGGSQASAGAPARRLNWPSDFPVRQVGEGETAVE
jgi:hypothetical protein